MDILIKSFNRPYYLDRCLYSISRYVKSGSGKIIVLDDGTPQVYLDKIATKYPDVIILKSDFYEKKQTCTSKGISSEDYAIPIDFWLKSAASASQNFLLLEDDIWFTDAVDLDKTDREMTETGTVLLKLFWVGNPSVIQSKAETTVFENIVLLKPKLFTTIPALYYAVFYKFDRFKIRKTLRFFKIHTFQKHLAYYTLYGVAGIIFKRDYFLRLWQNHKSSIDEGLQIYNAVKMFSKAKHQYKYGRYNKEILKTGFVSSATNQYKEDFGKNVDMFVFNKILNDAWLNDQLDVLSSLPHDISEEVVTTVLNNDSLKRISASDWKTWMQNFKNQYLSMGCKID